MQPSSIDKYRTYSDETLLQLISRKDLLAYEALYDRHAQTVHNLLKRIVHDSATAEELLQETFWQVWQKAEQYAEKGAVAAWLNRIARNKALDQLRHDKARPRMADDDIGMLEQSPTYSYEGAEKVVEQRLQQQQVNQALDNIPGEQRLCLELAYFEGMSQSQIAEYTSTPLGTIKTRMRIGMEKLERLLRASGYPE
ncbi:MAG: sigma-70 family RNA polymerase sigma factor [Chloroflexi bacterium]|nr:sigma-70 family RNA polymerase sigma factor [Chloroflexota bacterium]